ncbi:MAG TPA: 50S ribosomal protein L3 [Clostridiales bacterium]|mgnify:FL=1|jgi:large subunit ribosomal protein L3|nr:50S ribosomal protein L3 [Clostridiales bacterium]
MKKAILGKKLGMSQIFAADGAVIPVTVVEAGPCPIIQIKTKDKDGYSAIQIGFGEKKERRVNNPLKGHFKKSGVTPRRYLREFRIEEGDKFEVSQEIKCDIFAVGDKVDVTGISKGRGFTGTIQRWNTHRGPMAHGSGYHRGVGSLSGCSSPSRVFKNKKMPGQYGNEQVTIQNLEIVKVDTARNLLFIKGGIPGARNGLVSVKQTVKA